MDNDDVIEAVAKALYERTPVYDQEVDLDGRPTTPPYRIRWDQLQESNPGHYEDVLEDARVAIAAMPKEEWQSIETAPKDGTWILAWLGGIAQIADTIQWAYGGWWNGSDGYVRSSAHPTHWRHLPDPPVTLGGDE